MNPKVIGEIIKEKRKSLKLTQAYLAAVANVGVRFISDVENGKETAEIGKVFKVLNSLNLNVEIVINE